MARILTPARGFFAVRKDGCQEFPAWPSGAIVVPRPQHALVTARGDERSIDVLRGSTLDDALAAARRAVDCESADAVRIGRCLGTFGRPALYESALLIAADEDRPAIDRWLPPDADEAAAAAGGDGGITVKNLGLQVRKAAGDTIEGWGSTTTMDRDEDVIEAGAFRESLPAYLTKNPIVFFNHDMWRPIGTVVEAEIRDVGLWVKCRIVDEEIQKLIAEGVLRTFSVSFIIRDFRWENLGDPDKNETRIITRAELIEVSVVSIPSNRDAIFTVAKAWKQRNRVAKFLDALERDADQLCCATKIPALVDYRRFPVGDPAAAWGWDAKAIRGRFGGHVLRLCGTVERDGDPLLPHHTLVGDELRTSPQGVRLAMAQLLAGEVALDEAERRASWTHLAAHYEEFGAAAPDLTDGRQPGQYAKTLGTHQPGLIFSRSRFDEPRALAWARERGFDVRSLTPGSHTLRSIPEGRVAGEQLTVADGVTLVLTRKDEDDTMTRKQHEDGSGDPPKETPAEPADGNADAGTPETPPQESGDRDPQGVLTAEEMREAIRAGVVAGIREAQGSPGGDADLQDVPIPLSEEAAGLVEFIDRYRAESLSPEARQRLAELLKEEVGALQASGESSHEE